MSNPCCACKARVQSQQGTQVRSNCPAPCWLCTRALLALHACLAGFARVLCKHNNNTFASLASYARVVLLAKGQPNLAVRSKWQARFARLASFACQEERFFPLDWVSQLVRSKSLPFTTTCVARLSLKPCKHLLRTMWQGVRQTKH